MKTLHFSVGKSAPGATVLLSDNHHLVEIPPHALPDVTEGSVIEFKVEIDKKATKQRANAFKDLEKKIIQRTEREYITNTPSQMSNITNIYCDFAEVILLKMFMSVNVNCRIREIKHLAIKYIVDFVPGVTNELEQFNNITHKEYRYKPTEINVVKIYEDLLPFIDSCLQENVVGALLLRGEMIEMVACVVICYIMQHYEFPLSIAANHVRKILPSLSPKFIYMSQLQEFEDKLFKTKDSSYLASYVKEKLPTMNASLDDIRTTLESNNNDVSKTMDILCPTTQ